MNVIDDRNARGSSTKKEDRARLREIVRAMRKHKVGRRLSPIKLYDLICELGPTFVKLGQILSMRDDLLPKEYCEQLSNLRTDVQPLDFPTIKMVLETELGGPVEQFFRSVEETAKGSASIAQVHAAILADGQEVVLKIQRPGIYERMERDISIFRRVTRQLKIFIPTLNNMIDLDEMILEIWHTAQKEMDFLNEARNMERFAALHKDTPHTRAPRVFRELTTPLLLVMEWIRGLPVDRPDELKAVGVDSTKLSKDLINCYCKQIMDDGFFQADPHPGNLLYSDGDIVWLDLGMMGEMSYAESLMLRKAVEAAIYHDVERLKEVILDLAAIEGRGEQDVDHQVLFEEIDRMLSKYIAMPMEEMNMGEIFQDFLQIASSQGLTMPSAVTMLGRSILTIQGTLVLMDPTVNFAQLMRDYVERTRLRPGELRARIGKELRKITGSLEKAIDLPQDTALLVKNVSRGRLKFQIEWSRAKQDIEAERRKENKLIAALIVAALLLFSAILLTVDSRLTKGLAVAGLSLAPVIAVGLLITVYKERRR
ncbi:MAG: ABC1 kinase family protein [Fastidiosipilaceae bacterium]|jgi:ubiquinone biosynthesis protein